MPHGASLPPGCLMGPAAAAELDAARRLVAASGLPAAGLEDQFPRGFLAARRGAQLVGTAGLEEHGRHGLLRSVAVSPDLRGQGLGEALVRERLMRARSRDLASVHLLTTTAAGFFQRLGFRVVDRARVPPEIRGTREFAEVCPESAVVLVLEAERLPAPLS